MGPFRRVFLSVISAALHDPRLAEFTDTQEARTCRANHELHADFQLPGRSAPQHPCCSRVSYKRKTKNFFFYINNRKFHF